MHNATTMDIATIGKTPIVALIVVATAVMAIVMWVRIVQVAQAIALILPVAAMALARLEKIMSPAQAIVLLFVITVSAKRAKIVAVVLAIAVLALCVVMEFVMAQKHQALAQAIVD